MGNTVTFCRAVRRYSVGGRIHHPENSRWFRRSCSHSQLYGQGKADLSHRPFGHCNFTFRFSGANHYCKVNSVAAADSNDYGVEEEAEPVISANPPLGWQGLKNLDHANERIVAVGISPDVVKAMNGGLCSSGIMKDRLALPLCDSELS